MLLGSSVKEQHEKALQMESLHQCADREEINQILQVLEIEWISNRQLMVWYPSLH